MRGHLLLILVAVVAGVIGLPAPAQPADETEAQVDRAIKGAAFGQQGTKPLDQLRVLGDKAVPRLVHWLEVGHLNERRAAAYTFQHCWSPAARPAAKKYLGDKDHNVRELIGSAVRRHETPDIVVDIATSWLTDPNPAIAGQALDMVEAVSSDVARIKRALGDRRQWRYVIRHLPRYGDPSLTAETLKLLRAGALDERVAAVVSLIHQHAATPTARRQVAATMRVPNPILRDRCGEYFAWFGRPEDAPAIEAAIKTTRDPHALASLQAAIAQIQRRATLGLNQPAPDPAGKAIQPAATQEYAAALEALKSGDYSQAFTTLALGRAYEPIRQFRGDAWPADVSDTEHARTTLLRAIVGLPAQPRQAGVRDVLGAAELPKADQLAPPVRNYFDADRKSFGSAGHGPFGGSVHVGDDVAGAAPHETVVAVAAGRVRAVFVGDSWGGLIVIEHQREDGARFCSLYGHLGPLLLVEHGQTVEAGQKIGSVGRAFTWENGGYRAHLHLGIREGGYGIGTRTTGYLSPEHFADDQGGWRDPQLFLKPRN